jgi:hypothetical protein
VESHFSNIDRYDSIGIITIISIVASFQQSIKGATAVLGGDLDQKPAVSQSLVGTDAEGG